MLSNFIAAIIPVLVALMALAVAWGALLTRISVMRKSLHSMPGKFAKIQQDIKEDIDEVDLRVDKLINNREKLKKEYLLEKDHGLMCDNAMLKLERRMKLVIDNSHKNLLKEIKIILGKP